MLEEFLLLKFFLLLLRLSSNKTALSARTRRTGSAHA